MPNSGQQLKLLLEALLSAYPSHTALAMLVRFELDENLAAIAGTGSLSEVVFGLLQWAESQGRLDELVRKAHAHNPGNPELEAVARALLLWYADHQVPVH